MSGRCVLLFLFVSLVSALCVFMHFSVFLEGKRKRERGGGGGGDCLY